MLLILLAVIATSDWASGQVSIWIYLGINDNATVELASKLFIVAVSVVALLGFSDMVEDWKVTQCSMSCAAVPTPCSNYLLCKLCCCFRSGYFSC